MSKQLLIEAAEFTTPIKVAKGLKESVSVENNNDILIVRNIPATIADRKNQNGRIYSTEVLQEAIKNANFQLKTKWMYSQADEHPEGSFVAPTHASHVVINAYIKKNVKVFVEGKTERHNVMFMDWEILNTEEGKNLKALILQETACPTSIRGLGDMNGDYVVDYELLGCDVVSNPSSGTSMRMPVTESIKVEKADKSYLDESFEVTTVSNDTVADIEAAAQKQVDIEGSHYGTITNIKTKLDQEIDPKTQATTTITSIEATTTDEVSDLNQALQMAKNAFVNPVSKMDSVTITFVDDAEEESVKDKTEPALKEDEDQAPETTEEDPQMNALMDKEPDTNNDVEEPQSSSLPKTSNIIVNGLKGAVKNLNDMIADTSDEEITKQLQFNRNSLEKLIQQNVEKFSKTSSSETISEDDSEEDPNIEVDDNKVTTKLNNDTEIEKEFDSPAQAQVAVSAVKSGQADPSVLVPESSKSGEFVIQSEEEGQVVYYVSANEIPTETIENATKFKSQEDADAVRVSIADNKWPNAAWVVAPVQINEVLYTAKDEPSDPEVKPIKEEDGEETTPLNNNYNVYAFLDGQLKDEATFENEEEAIAKAKEFTSTYENNGTNFNVIVVKVDGNGFEDFDNLVYQYPEIEVAESNEEPITEYVVADKDPNDGDDDAEFINSTINNTEINNPTETLLNGINLDSEVAQRVYNLALEHGDEILAELLAGYLNFGRNNAYDILTYIKDYHFGVPFDLEHDTYIELLIELFNNIDLTPDASIVMNVLLQKNPEILQKFNDGLLSQGEVVLEIANILMELDKEDEGFEIYDIPKDEDLKDIRDQLEYNRHMAQHQQDLSSINKEKDSNI